MKLAKKLHIRVPGIKRVVKDNDNVYLVMDRIQGTTLEEAWARIGWLGTFRLGFQLRRIVHAMRTMLHANRGYFRSIDGTIFHGSGPRLMELPIDLVNRISTYEVSHP